MTTSITGNDIIKLGFDLLREGTLSIVDIVDAFKLAGVQSTELKLFSLKSSFGGDGYFKPEPLSATEINYPVHDRITDFSAIKPQEREQGLTALERLGSFVATDADEKISVFDLFKTVAAIQDCLRSGENGKPFLLVSADFSGIQDTVYTISSKGALKTLRARSFMLELLTEHIIHEIIGSDRHAVVFSGGGGFSLLLPNREDVIQNITNYRTLLNEWALDEFSGRLFFAIDALPFGKEVFCSETEFQKLRQAQADNLDRLKRRKFIDQLDVLFMPSMPEQLTVKTECQITRRDDLPDEFMFDIGVKLGEQMSSDNKHEDGRIWVSESCYHQFRIGDKLATAQSVVRSQKTPEGTEPYFKYPDINWSKEKQSWVYYRIGDQQIKSADCWFMNDWTAGQPILYANYVRKHGELSEYARQLENEILKEENRTAKSDDTATFQGLAASSCGADLIGSLRMDVDNMGNLFSEIGSLAELSAKSRMLNLFFKVYLKRICTGNLDGELKETDIVGKKYAENDGRNVSVIYSGGDDLFILGAWDETTELAFDIQRSFALFTGGKIDTENNVVIGGCGISGGITLHQPKFPLYQMARKSGEAEHVAKHARIALKNCFTLFLLSLDNYDISYEFYNNRTARVIDWNDTTFFELLNNLVALTEKQFIGNQINAIKLQAVSRGFIYKLFEEARVWVTQKSIYLPRLRYIFSRLEKNYDSKNVHKKSIQNLQNHLFSPSNLKRDEAMQKMILVLNWFEQLQRSK